MVKIKVPCNYSRQMWFVIYSLSKNDEIWDNKCQYYGDCGGIRNVSLDFDILSDFLYAFNGTVSNVEEENGKEYYFEFNQTITS